MSAKELPGVGGPERRPRRHDPLRRVRILDASLDVLYARGVAGTTHRAVAGAADVPLGSVTYHFVSLDDLLFETFARFVETQNALFGSFFDDVTSPDALVGALARLVEGSPARRRAAVLGFELRLAALRSPRLMALNADWSRASRETLATVVPAEDAGGLDAVVEGLIMHSVLSVTPLPAPTVRETIRRALTGLIV